MQYNAMHCNTMQYDAIQCSTVQCNAIQCNTMQCTAMHCNTLQSVSNGMCFALPCNVMCMSCRLEWNAIRHGMERNMEWNDDDAPGRRGGRQRPVERGGGIGRRVCVCVCVYVCAACGSAAFNQQRTCVTLHHAGPPRGATTTTTTTGEKWEQ